MAKEMKKLPNIGRNPLLVLEMAEELREHADNVAKAAAEAGKPARARTKLLKIRAFAKELEDLGNAKLGSHEADINHS